MNISNFFVSAKQCAVVAGFIRNNIPYRLNDVAEKKQYIAFWAIIHKIYNTNVYETTLIGIYIYILLLPHSAFFSVVVVGVEFQV